MACLWVSIGCLGCAAAPRLVDASTETGFAVYRSGELSRRELRRLCSLGVEELLVLDGSATDRECRMRQLCPDLRVRYNFAQDPESPVSVEFLKAFDRWIEEGRASGRKLAFRCRHGWHRAGRLTAYYEMRFMGASVQEAIDEMQSRGHWMWRHPRLDPQVRAFAELLAGQPCSGGVEVCPQSVEPTSEGLQPDGSFPSDICIGSLDSEVGG